MAQERSTMDVVKEICQRWQQSKLPSERPSYNVAIFVSVACEQQVKGSANRRIWVRQTSDPPRFDPFRHGPRSNVLGKQF